MSKDKPTSKRRNPITPEERTNRLVSLAEDQAEKQLLAGTASPSVIVHFLKQGTIKNQLELKKLEKEVELLKAKRESIESAQSAEEMYSEAIKAFRRYSGDNDDEDKEL